MRVFRCMKCGKKLFEVIGGEPTTALSIKCSKCRSISIFDYLPKIDEYHPIPAKAEPHKNAESVASEPR